MLVILEGIVMCFVLLIVCVISIANGAVGGVALYEKDVQKRVVELGYTTEKKIKRNRFLLSLSLFVPLFTIAPFMVYGINGAVGFFDGFWQLTAIFWIMGLFDRLFIDWYWVGHTKAWNIPKTEDLKPYIPKSALALKWCFTVLGFPLIAAAIAGVMTWIL